MLARWQMTVPQSTPAARLFHHWMFPIHGNIAWRQESCEREKPSRVVKYIGKELKPDSQLPQYNDDLKIRTMMSIFRSVQGLFIIFKNCYWAERYAYRQYTVHVNSSNPQMTEMFSCQKDGLIRICQEPLPAPASLIYEHLVILLCIHCKTMQHTVI